MDFIVLISSNVLRCGQESILVKGQTSRALILKERKPRAGE
jgi:hypothetical protein